MKISADTLPDDINALKQLILSQQDEVEKYQQQISSLQEQLRLYIHKRFGQSSEQAPANQLGLFNEGEVIIEENIEIETSHSSGLEALNTEEENEEKRLRKRGGRKPLPDYLPRIEVIHDLPEVEKVCQHDGHTLERIGEESSEQLDVVPAKIQVIKHIRYKYACPCCDQTIKQASLPPQPIPKSQAAPGLLAHVAVSKYLDALPLYRQSDMWQRAGIIFDRTTLANWMIKTGELLTPLINLMQDRLLESPLIHCDETTVQVLKEPDKPVSSKSYMWVRVAGPPGQRIHLFDYDPSRSSQVPKRLLEGYHGALMTDGYEGYRAVIEAQSITSAGCWAHARRKFDECIKGQPKNAKSKTGKAQQGLAYIQKLYQIEKSLATYDEKEKHNARQTLSKPVINTMRQWLDKSLPQVPPQSLLGKALHYLNNQWPKLTVFLDYGIVPLDNNVAENAIRPFVLGRKNWLFSTSQAGAKSSAAIYSVIQTAKINGLEPYAYLKEVLAELPKANTVGEIENLLPIKSGHNPR